MARYDEERENGQIRKTEIVRDFIKYAEGSVLICTGNTKVICTATVEDKVPPFKKGTSEGWVTAEYSMLPRATGTRNPRDIAKLKLNGRSQEIQRLIGRALRSVVDFKALGERTVIIDCDVIQADGGTRTASINGGFVAMMLAFKKLKDTGIIKEIPVNGYVAAISAGVVNDEVLVDLCYEEDSHAQVDMNIVMKDGQEFIEIQGTGEGRPFTNDEFLNIINISKPAIENIINIQKEALEGK